MTRLNIPTITDIEQISRLSDPVIRNLQITQCYHELAHALRERTGANANWCTFATWASKQAGQTIRKEDLARTLDRLLKSESSVQQSAADLSASGQQGSTGRSPAAVLNAIWKAWDPASAFDRSSQAVARGNLKVFAEIGREFARFYAHCLDDTEFDAEKINRFTSELRPGDPPEGQRYLAQAFKCYYQSIFEQEYKTRTELLLLANIEIGLHEQTRLQPEINEALDAPIIDPREFARNLYKELYPNRSIFSNMTMLVMRWFGRLVKFDRLVDEFVTAVRRQAQFLITENLMSISLPQNIVLRLGDDLPANFQDILQQISNPELSQLLAQIDPSPNSTRQSGADYWGDLPDRLHFIADLFRCYQVTPDLFDAPFNTEQTAALKQGNLPAGRL